jgi:TP901 family phage tail tape measure protein
MALTVAQLTARLTADTSNFYKGMAVADAAMFRTGSIARRIGVGASLAVAGIGIMSLKMAGDFEESMHVLGAVSGATKGELKMLQDGALALGKDMKLPNVSAKDAAESMTELAKAGLSVKDIMGASRGVLQLGVAGNMKFSESATVVARALTAFSMKGVEATRVADLLTATANKSTAEVNDMALGIQMASSQFAAAGFDVDDLTTSLGLMANAGIAGSDAGTSLKTMMNRLTAPTSTARKKMQELGISVYDASGNVKKMPVLLQHFNDKLGGLSKEARNAALYTMFGSDAIRAARVQLTAGAEGWTRFNEATTKGGEAQAFAEARTKGFNGAVEGFISQVETLAIELGLKMLPAATSAARGLAEFVGNLDVGKITAFFGAIANVVKVIWDIVNSSTLVRNMFIGLIAGFVAVKVVIEPMIAMFTSLATAVRGAGLAFAFLAANPIALFAGAALALTVGMSTLTSALRDTAVSARDVANALQSARDASLALENATLGVTGAELNLKAAQIERKSAAQGLAQVQGQVRSGALQGAAATKALEQAELRLARADLGVKQSKTALKGAISEEGKAVKTTQKEYAGAITTASKKLQQDQIASRLFPFIEGGNKRVAASQKSLTGIIKEAGKEQEFHTKTIDKATQAGGPASKALTGIGDSVKKWNFKKAADSLKDIPKNVQGIGPPSQSAATTVGQGIATGIGAGITSAPAVTAAVRAVQEAIAAAKVAAKIKSPSEVAAKELGSPLAAGIAQGIDVAAPQVNTALMQSILKPIPLLGAYAVGAAKNIAKKYTDAQLLAFVTGSQSLPEKMGASLKRMINKQKSILDAAKPMFDKWFSRLQDRAMRAFDAVTAAARTPSEIALGGQTASEKMLADETAGRDAAALQNQENDANSIVSEAAAKRAAIARKAGETETEYQERRAEELKQIAQDLATAQETIANVAWERRRAILEGNAASERKLLEESAAQERLDWESRRENERLALEDRITKLQENLLKGKITMQKANAEINGIMKAAGVDMANSGKILGREFAAGLAATRGQVLRQARRIAAAVKRILKLNSPAKEGPLSDLDTWWDAFVPTLTSGLDTRGLNRAVSSAVAPPSLSGIGSRGTQGTTINLTVSDQTFAGMSREQADRVARDIKAALDRQVSYTI